MALQKKKTKQKILNLLQDILDIDLYDILSNENKTEIEKIRDDMLIKIQKEKCKSRTLPSFITNRNKIEIKQKNDKLKKLDKEKNMRKIRKSFIKHKKIETQKPNKKEYRKNNRNETQIPDQKEYRKDNRNEKQKT